MKTITAADRAALIRLASTLPKGSEERKAILAGIDKAAGDPSWRLGEKMTYTEAAIVFRVMSHYKGHEVQPDPDSFKWGRVQSKGPNISLPYTMALTNGEVLQGWVSTSYDASRLGVTVETRLELAG